MQFEVGDKLKVLKCVPDENEEDEGKIKEGEEAKDDGDDK